MCCTTGILRGILNERELRAVLGHELSRLQRDILISRMAGALAAVITRFGQHGHVGHGMFGGNRDNANPFALLLVALLGPDRGNRDTGWPCRDRRSTRPTSQLPSLTGPAVGIAKISGGVQAAPLPPGRSWPARRT